MQYRRMAIEIESPEEQGYDTIAINLTESSFSDARLTDFDLSLDDLLACYGDHRGLPELRELLAGRVGGVTAADVLVTPGAACALFIVATSLLKAGDRMVVMAPNYASNLETPRAIGAEVVELPLSFEGGWAPDLDQLEALVDERTKLVSLTCPHNPTGTVMSEAELRRVIDICKKHDAVLLFDETYRDMTLAGPIASAASLYERAISVSSLSKTFGLPGLRIGWLAVRDPALSELFLAAKEQIVITGSVVDETLAARFLARVDEHLPRILTVIRRRLALTEAFFARTAYFEWVAPSGGVVAFPRLRPELGVDPLEWRRTLEQRYGTFVGPGHWFEQSAHHFRLGWGWPEDEALAKGLQHLDDAVADCLAGRGVPA